MDLWQRVAGLPLHPQPEGPLEHVAVFWRLHALAAVAKWLHAIAVVAFEAVHGVRTRKLFAALADPTSLYLYLS